MAKEKSSIHKNSENSNHADITLSSKGDVAKIIATDNSDQSLALSGFDPQFQDVVDYIVKITHEIWEERAIGRLYDYYATNMRIHTSSGDIFTRDKVIEGTIQSLAAFPNRRLYADEVIWGVESSGFYSSHRITHEGNNWGHTNYGPPTGRKISYRAVADCHIIDNVIVEEWLIRDELSLVHQLGFDVHELARKFAAQEQDSSHLVSVPAEVDRLRGQLPPKPYKEDGQSDVENFVKRSIHEVWNWRLLNKIEDYYSAQYICESASGRHLYGRNQYTNYILSLLSPFPDMAISVDHFCVLNDGPNRQRTATRWTMMGTHTGPGIYGQPTGKQIRIIGVTHHLIENGKFVQEWTLFDEFALLKQLYKAE